MRYVVAGVISIVLVVLFVVGMAGANKPHGPAWDGIERFAGTLTATDVINWSSRAKLSSPAGGCIAINNAAGTINFSMKVNPDGVVTLYDGDCSSSVTALAVGSGGSYRFDSTTNQISYSGGTVQINNASGVKTVMKSDTATAGAALLSLTTNSATVGFSDTDGTQHALYIYPELEQSGTAAFNGIYLDVDDNGQGSGQDYLINLNWDGSQIFFVTDTGEIKPGAISGDGSGKAACIKADGNLGTCTDAVGAGGTCTCS